MQVGDLVLCLFSSEQPMVGIIIQIWGGCEADVLFPDGEYQMALEDLEVLGEC